MNDYITESMKDNHSFHNHQEREYTAYFWEEYEKAYIEARMYGHATFVVSGDAAILNRSFVIDLLNMRRDTSLDFKIETDKQGMMSTHKIKLYKEE